MKKEKTIRTYQRRTKTGKVVTVKQHTAKYDAAEALKEVAKKKGAGEELEALKKKPIEKAKKEELPDSDILKALDEISEGDMKKYLEGDVTPNGRISRKVDSIVKKYLGRKGFDDWAYYADETGNYGKNLKEFKSILERFKSGKGAKDLQKALDSHPIFEIDPKTKKGRVTSLKELRKEAKTKDTAGGNTKSSDSGVGFTADEYKAWYHWDQDADPKNKSALKVEKALKKQMGTKAYNKYFDELTDSYSSRGHNKAFKGLGEKLSTGEKKPVTSGKEKTKKEVDSDAKVSKEDAAKLKKAEKRQSDYVKHLMRLHKDGVKDKQMGGYIAAEKQILEDLKKHKGSLKSNGELSDTEEAFAKQNRLSYEEDGMYSSKDGKIYRISVHPITGAAKAYPLTGNTMGANKAQLRAAGLKGDDYDTVDYDKLSDIIWGSKSKRSKEDDWKSAPKNSGKYAAGKQKEGAAKEGLHYAMGGKSRKEETPKQQKKVTIKGGKQSFVVAGLRMDPTNYNSRRTFSFDPATGEVHGRWSDDKEKRLTRFLNAGNRTKVANAIEKKFGAEAKAKFLAAATEGKGKSKNNKK